MFTQHQKYSLNKRLSFTVAEDFLFAGSSALLLRVASSFPEYWYISFFALTPLLYRLSRAAPRAGLRLGLLFGLSFFAVLNCSTIFASPIIALIRICAGLVVTSSFGCAVAWTRDRWGFNPIIVALLWIVVELAGMKLGFATAMFQDVALTQPVLHGFAAIFGFLFVAFAIVLVNSILVQTLGNAVLVISTSWGGTEARKQEYETIYNLSYRLHEVSYVPQERAPPSSIYMLKLF